MDISKIGNFSPAQLPSPGKAQAPGSFGEIYQEQLTATPPTDAQLLTNAKTDLMDQGDKVLDLLEAYSADLNNPDKTLKEIDPLATAIEEEMNIFETKRTDQMGMDEEMAGFADALAITANVALLKFRRGDYL